MKYKEKPSKRLSRAREQAGTPLNTLHGDKIRKIGEYILSSGLTDEHRGTPLQARQTSSEVPIVSDRQTDTLRLAGAVSGVDEMQHSQRGIALVETVLAIVLLGIVGVTALGQFEGLSIGSAAAVYKSVDARTSSAAAINYTVRILDPFAGVALQSGDDCANGPYGAAFPSDYGAAGAGFNCR